VRAPPLDAANARQFTIIVRAVQSSGNRRSRRSQLTWWARDDRGNHYLATPGDDRKLLRFLTPAGPARRMLDLMPTAIDSHHLVPSAMGGQRRMIGKRSWVRAVDRNL
jgi:hypothetical protein